MKQGAFVQVRQTFGCYSTLDCSEIRPRQRMWHFKAHLLFTLTAKYNPDNEYGCVFELTLLLAQIIYTVYYSERGIKNPHSPLEAFSTTTYAIRISCHLSATLISRDSTLGS